MTSPFVAEIRIVGFNFAPKGWAFCDGQVLPISQNTALFSLLGTTYGGDGKSNFALPNMQGNAPMFWGQGPGLSLRDLGEIGGEQNVTLLQSEIPAHAHFPVASNGGGGVTSPAGASWGGGVGRNPPPGFDTTNSVQMSPAAIGITGGDLPHNNMPPFLTMNFVIALQGIFPARP
jgi:microcystin-dependent protein